MFAKVRDEIEQLLDDDGDMAEMYLTDKLLRAQLEGTLSPTSSHGDDPMSPSHFPASKGNIQGDMELNKNLSSEQFTVPESEDDNARSAFAIVAAEVFHFLWFFQRRDALFFFSGKRLNTIWF